jgi:putative acetyltransferase
MNSLLREIEKKDNREIALVIRKVLTEFGANRPGFAFADPELDFMFESYQNPKSIYYICEVDGKIIAGAGLMKLDCSLDSTCELQKMYMLPIFRGAGLGRQLLQLCINRAIDFGYRNMYLETLHSMQSAQKLYLLNGFQKISEPLGNTGHHGCDVFMLKKLY